MLLCVCDPVCLNRVRGCQQPPQPLPPSESLYAGLLYMSFCPQVKTKGARRITFEQFLTALSKLAERKVGLAAVFGGC
jgi:hypothetical protein